MEKSHPKQRKVYSHALFSLKWPNLSSCILEWL